MISNIKYELCKDSYGPQGPLGLSFLFLSGNGSDGQGGFTRFGMSLLTGGGDAGTVGSSGAVVGASGKGVVVGDATTFLNNTPLISIDDILFFIHPVFLQLYQVQLFSLLDQKILSLLPFH